jgi:hypothetical protein
MSLETKITDYLMGKVHFTYHNFNHIDIECIDDESFRASVCLLDFDNDAPDLCFVSLDFYCRKKDFLWKLNIRSLQDLDSVTESMLMHLYNQGEADMVCFVQFVYLDCMSYRRDGNRTIAKNNSGDPHVVDAVLETPMEFIGYTKQYYMVQRSNTTLYP